MDAFLTLFFLAFAGIFIFAIVMVGKAIYGSIAEKQYNDSQPVLTKDSKITSKRTEVSGGRGHSSVSTTYYATFEFADNKERLELVIGSEDYGLMAEGDLGKLTFQGRRYLEFHRNL
ncbi:MAG TPA: DUF2500 domain-containing protein [Pyrinomonadaceae bacterium]|jgi:hypothetical protein|nr:DUF2500 domain-containing protein [Pyrinomonadaceae bacterium]